MPVSRGLTAIHICAATSNLRSGFFVSRSSYDERNRLFFKKGGNCGDFLPTSLRGSGRTIPCLVASVGVFGHSFTMLRPRIERQVSSIVPSFAQGLSLPCKCGGFDVRFTSLACGGPNLGQCTCRLMNFSGS